MAAPFQTRRQVQWRDTDAAGIMHFSVFFVYMEQAEHELLRQLGLSVSFDDGPQKLSFPRVSAKCDYQRPLRFDDQVDIEVRVERLGEKSITYDFQFRLAEEAVARGSMTCVCCRVDTHPPRSVPIPQRVAAQLRDFADEGG